MSSWINFTSDEMREAKGEGLMRKHDAYYPILRHKPESDASIINNGGGTPNSLSPGIRIRNKNVI